MGLGPHWSFHSDPNPPLGNPVPHRFKIIETYSLGDNHLVAKVKYPDANNYEGNKILVFRGEGIVNKVLSATTLDPHFSNTGLAPFARFEPTQEGWNAAKKLVNLLFIADSELY